MDRERNRAMMLALGFLLSAGTAGSEVAINSVNVIDVETGAVLEDRTIVIASDRIVDVVSAATYEPAEGVRQIDGNGLFAMPGLWDMHIHMLNDVTEPVDWDFHSPAAEDPDQRQIYMPLYLAFGITGTRELSGGLRSIALREQIRGGEILGPHMVVGSPLLDGPHPIWPESPHISIDSPDSAVVVAERLHAQGFDFLKTYNFLSLESYRALHRTARSLGIEVSGEIPISVSLWEAAELGHRTVEHLTGVEFASSRHEEELRSRYVARIDALNADPSSESPLDIWSRSEWEPLESLDVEKRTRLFAHLVEHETWVVPTIVIQRMVSRSEDPEIANNPNFRYIDRWARDLTAAADEYDPERRLRPLHEYRAGIIDELHLAGVGILAGSDTPGGFTLLEELEIFVDAGLTPLDALRTATLNAARYLGREEDYGTVAPRRVADIVLLRENPLEDIRNTRSIETVVFQGHVLERAQLDRMLEQLAEDAENWTE
ncbi:MAG: amidohydrolase [Gemmatimonadota bacterium]|nr:MAG: amidohydrolase [Gemmatimonadota bacterium]